MNIQQQYCIVFSIYPIRIGYFMQMVVKHILQFLLLLRPLQRVLLQIISIFVGLWEVCLNNFHDMRHQYEYRFNGCRHILLEEYDIIREEIQPRK